MSDQSIGAKFLGFTAIGLALLLSALWVHADDGGSTDQRRDIPNAGFDELHVNLGADFSRYRTVLIEDAPVSFVARWVNVHRSAVSNRDIARLKRDTANDLKAELTEKISKDGRYRIVEETELDTLVIRPRIINLNVAAPGSGQHIKLVDSPGYATLSLEMYDAYSDLLIVKLLDHREAKGPSGREFFMANPATNAREFRLLMSAWAERVRTQLDLLSTPNQVEQLSAD